MAAPVISALGVPAFGIGGPDLGAAGASLVANVRDLAAMGPGAAVRTAPALFRALLDLARSIERSRPAAALLVGFSEVNSRIAWWLRRRDVRVLWYAPPQVWAWRQARARAIARVVDRLAVLLPFEAEVWRREGGRVDYVGHPAVERAPRAPLGDISRPAVALLPGSRRSEVHAHLPAMLEAVENLRSERGGSYEVRVVLSRALPDETARWARGLATARRAHVVRDPVAGAVSGASVALVASGTATLECAALDVPPVIVYRTDPLTYAVASRLVRVPFVGLPNLLLGRAAFPELLQGAVTARRLRDAVLAVLEDPRRYENACREVQTLLSNGLGTETPAARVARLLEPWLA